MEGREEASERDGKKVRRNRGAMSSREETAEKRGRGDDACRDGGKMSCQGVKRWCKEIGQRDGVKRHREEAS